MRSTKKDKNQRRKPKKKEKRNKEVKEENDKPCAIYTLVLSSTQAGSLFLSIFPLNFRRKNFGGPREKTPSLHQFSFLSPLQPDTHKNYFLSLLFHPLEVSPTK